MASASRRVTLSLHEPMVATRIWPGQLHRDWATTQRRVQPTTGAQPIFSNGNTHIAMLITSRKEFQVPRISAFSIARSSVAVINLWQNVNERPHVGLSRHGVFVTRWTVRSSLHPRKYVPYVISGCGKCMNAWDVVGARKHQLCR